MFEVVICSLFTVLPDYLYRHYYQGKRIGHEITLFSVWYELRWGITACVMLTVLLITLIFYYHPSTRNAVSYYRTIPIIPEVNGRVSEVFVKLSEPVKQGQPIFKLDSSKQEAALELAKRRVAEIDAAMIMARADIAAAAGQVQQAKGMLQQAIDELRMKEDLRQRNSGIVATRDIEKLQNSVDASKGQLAAAEAQKSATEIRLSTLLPAEKATAEANLAQAQVELDKTVIKAGVSGRVEQFVLRPGDIVNPFARPAGVLIPEGAGRKQVHAGFGQIEGQVMRVGMAAEVSCVSKPLTIIPMVVTGVQDFIATGQFRATEQLQDLQQTRAPGTITVTLEPLYAGGLDGVIPGSSCTANVYSSNHDRLASGEAGLGEWIFLHIIDTVGVVHAAMIRVQALLLPVRTLVLAGH